MWAGRKMMVLGALLASTAVGGCASGMASDEGAMYGVAPAASERTALVIENNNWQDMVVYLLKDGMRHRLGNVQSLASGRFRLTPSMIGGSGSLRIVADPIGSTRAWVSEPIHIQPGDVVQFKLENNISLSSYLIR